MRSCARTVAVVAILALAALTPAAVAPQAAVARAVAVTEPGPDLGQAVNDAVGYCIDGIVKEGKDEALRLLAGLLFRGEPVNVVEILDIVHTATGAYEISYKAQDGTLTTHDIWEAGRIAVKLAGHVDGLIPPEYRPAVSLSSFALWLTLKVGTPWLYCMEAAAYVTQQAAIWVAAQLRPIIDSLVSMLSDELWPGLVGWLRSLTRTEPPAATGPPAMPTGLTATPAGPWVIELRWRDNSGDETGFVVFNGNEDRQVAANQTSYRWATTPGSYMCANVRATNAHGDSARFPDREPWYVCTTTPARPSGVPARNGQLA